ncbi:MAG: helix-turn-helix domain-containing protein [Planctomycetes bacterium]|nr:helix-turn-helix domain-containing protein [Planctomycetota bacterium]
MAIEDALRKTSGNKTRAAKLLKISPRTFYRKMKIYKINFINH